MPDAAVMTGEERQRAATVAMGEAEMGMARRDPPSRLLRALGKASAIGWRMDRIVWCARSWWWCLLGSFTMGSPASEAEKGSGEAQLRVSIERSFAVGRFGVTFHEWDACVADGGCDDYKPNDKGWGRGRRPVINVSWNDAKGYTTWLARRTGKSYRLLSEAEREYVTRASTTTPFWWGASITPAQANYDGNYTYQGGGAKGDYRQRTEPVDSFEANPWGLYNVHGNVWEWTEDCWNSDNIASIDLKAATDAAIENFLKRGLTSNPGNGGARTTGDCSSRVIRGGSWVSVPKQLRSAFRFGFISSGRSHDFGFRVARTLTP